MADINEITLNSTTYDLNVKDGKITEQKLSTELQGKINNALQSSNIADNLTTDDATKVLSAKQGKVLKRMVDDNQVSISQNTHTLHIGSTDTGISAPEGYEYMGIAHPNDDDITPYRKIWYLAMEAGVYTNKGNKVVNDHEVAILKYDTTWRIESTRIANRDVANELAIYLNQFLPLSRMHYFWGFIASNSAVLYITDSYHHIVIPVKEGDSVHIRANASKNTNYAYLASYSEPKSVIEGYDVIGSRVTIPADVNNNTTVPSGAKYILILTKNEDDTTPQELTINGNDYVTGIWENVNTLKSSVESIRTQVSGFRTDIKSTAEYLGRGTITMDSTHLPIQGNGWIRVGDGAVIASGAYSHSIPILVHKGDLVRLDDAYVVNAVSLISKVTSDGTFVSTLLRGSGVNPDNYTYRMQETCYVMLSCLTVDLLDAYIVTGELVGFLEGNAPVSKETGTNLVTISDNPLATIMRDSGYAGIIHSWGIIGDSLASGEMQCFNDESISASDYKFIDMYQWSWGQRFAKLNGVEAYNFSNGGQWARNWVHGVGTPHDPSYIGGAMGGGWQTAKLPEYHKQGYIIALGVNDKVQTPTLGSVATDIGTYDPNTDTDTNPNTFVGNYSAIIMRLKSIQPKCKIFCVTPLSQSYSEYAQAIRDMVEYWSEVYEGDIYLIDLATYCPISWSGVYNMNGHGSAIGYEYTAFEISTYIDWIIRRNGSAFKAAALIGTEYREHFSE